MVLVLRGSSKRLAPWFQAAPPALPTIGGDGSVTLSAMAGAPSTTTYVPDGRSTGTARLPRTWLDTRSPALQGLYEGTVWDVSTFAGATATAKKEAVQVAIYNGTIKGSDIVEFEAGSTGAVYEDLSFPPRPIDEITGRYTTRDPSGQNLWITFRSKRHAELPAEGTRVQPYAADGSRTAGPDAGKFFVVRGSTRRRAVGSFRSDDNFAEGLPIPWGDTTHPERASFYRVEGVETQMAVNGPTAQVVCFGSPSGGDITTLDDIPTDLILDRSFVHGSPPLTMKAGVGLHCKRGAVVDSFIEDTGGHLIEAQGIILYNGPGPYKIVNNTIVGTTETVMSGGADPGIRDMRPSDLEFRRNDVTKWAWWNPLDSQYDGNATNRFIKNLFEFKIIEFALIEGNTFRNIWKSQQTGGAFLLKSVNQDGGTNGDWSKSVDIVVRFNQVEYATSMFIMAGEPTPPCEEPLSRVLVEHNIGLAIGDPWTYPSSGSADSQTYGAFFVNSGPVIDQDVRHNFCECRIRGIFSTSAKVNSRGGFVGNVFAFGSNSSFGGIQDDGTPDTPQGFGSFQYFWPDGAWLRNVIYNVPSAKLSLFDQTNDNVVLTTQSAVGFVDPASGNFRIGAGSPYADRGADWTAVAAYTAGVRDAAVGSPNGGA